MRLKGFHNFRINESIKEKFLSKDDIDYLLQSIKDQYEFDKFTLEYKLLKNIDSDDLENHTFYNDFKPGHSGYLAYDIDLHFDDISVEYNGEFSKIDPETGFEVAWIPVDNEYDLYSNAGLDREIEKFIKRLRATFDIKEIEYVVHNDTHSRSRVRPKISILMYNTDPITLLVQDFVDIYDIKDCTVKDNKLYINIPMTDLTRMFLRDEQQQMWLDQGYVDYNIYNSNDYIRDDYSSITYEINNDNKALIINHIVIKYFDGDISIMSAAVKESIHEDLLDFIFNEYLPDDDELLEVVDIYRDMYIQSISRDDYELLYNEMTDYIKREYEISNIEVIGRTDQKKKYNTSDFPFMVDTTMLSIELPNSIYDYIDRTNRSDSMSEIWISSSSNSSRKYLDIDGSDYTRIDRDEFNKEIAHIFVVA